MSSPEQDISLQTQRDVTTLALDAVSGTQFALAGSGAIREHGITGRPTEDIDLFTNRRDSEAFAAAVATVTNRLSEAGYQVEPIRESPEFARLAIATDTGLLVTCDLGVDWRATEPVRLEIGPVLSLTDAVGSKAAALYGRAEARDFLDVDAIRATGRFSDDTLLAAIADREPSFDLAMFADQLQNSQRLTPVQVAPYGISSEQLAGIQERCSRWGETLAGQALCRRPGSAADVVLPCR